ncbi:MAG: hypothetical protein DMG13_21690 [Acidobacteria bacterium]|nr:MAG: hypothetical protein DMG13_21690 [Acidobacteriota bacterium]
MGRLTRHFPGFEDFARFRSAPRLEWKKTSLSDPAPDRPLFFKEMAHEDTFTASRKRGAIYARYSSDMQNTSESIEVQITECKKYAVIHGIVIGRSPFVDRPETGTSTENRKAYQEPFTLA